MSDIYMSGKYVDRNPTYHVEDSPAKAWGIFEMVRRNGLVPGTVCDIGCGAGEVLRQLQGHLPEGTELHGYEISPQAFEMARDRENDFLKFYCRDFLTEHTEVFDLLTCIDVFEHVDDYLGFLRALQPRSRYGIFHIPLDMTAQNILKPGFMPQVRTDLGHLHYFNKDTALMTLEDAGYEVLDYFYTALPIGRGETTAQRLRNAPKRIPRRILGHLHKDLEVRLLGGASLMVLTR